MSILDELKKLILAREGSVAGVRNIADAVKVLASIEGAETAGAQTIADGIREIQEYESGTNVNPLSAFIVEGDFEATTTQLLGKSLSDIQTDVEIENGKVTGTAKYISGWTAFSGDPALQSGHFLALHADVPDVAGVTYKAKLTNEVTLDNDQIVIFFLDGREGKPFIFTASKDGFSSAVRTLDWSGLTLAPEV